VLETIWGALGLAVAHIAAAFAVGFGVGATLQWMYVPKWKDEQLRKAVYRWWQRFRDLRWSNFSQAEAKTAVELMDRFVGRGWRRIKIAAALLLGLYCLSFAWFFLISFICTSILGMETRDIPTTSFKRAAFSLVVLLIVTGILFVMSLSVTRWIALAFTRFGGSKVIGVALFATLLAIHVFLLLYWSNVTRTLAYFLRAVGVTLSVWADYGFTTSSTLPANVVSDAQSDIAEPFSPHTFGSFYALTLPFSTITQHIFSFGVKWNSLLAFEFTKGVLDVLCNGLRIVFALVFLGSYLFRPILQIPITNAWERAMDDKRPVLGMLLGSAAGGVVLVTEVVGLLATGIQALRTAL
jgi:hypothetical protein